ncbi:KRFJ protein, partial [Rhinopomastus cyanomelas]|nr:KRFJ protein [Rhinopomastus cyanomelas]
PASLSPADQPHLANSCYEPGMLRCVDSTFVTEPSLVVMTLLVPILTSFPQSTAVGSS